MLSCSISNKKKTFVFDTRAMLFYLALSAESVSGDKNAYFVHET